MKSNIWITVLIVCGLLLVLTGSVGAQGPEPRGESGVQVALGTAFTYQGQLKSGDTRVNGNCDFRFILYDAEVGGSQVGPIQERTGINVTDGLFTIADLDFGDDAFTGEARWLEIAVQCGGDPGYTTLGRQALTATPYALYALGAPWSGLTGVPAGLDDGDDDTTYTAGTGLDLTDTTFSVVTTTIQQRITGACGAGYAIRQVNTDGSVVCEADDDTTYTAGTGLDLTDSTFSVVTATIQQRITGACGTSYAIRVVHADGTVTCEPVAGGTGDITAVYAGTGLTGGGEIGAVTLTLDSAYTDARYWMLGGNAGTVPGTHFLGTTDAVSLTLAVSGTAALRLEPNTTSPNLIGGYGGNSVTAGAVGATIGGGGSSGNLNQVTDNYGTVGGGANNLAGYADSIPTNGPYTTVGGGYGNIASVSYATVGGGNGNTAYGGAATVGGGANNTTNGGSVTIGGGENNTANGFAATVGGGNSNIANNYGSTVAGGENNTAASIYATVGGGVNNTAAGIYATVAGGGNNRADADYSTVCGGDGNQISLLGDYASIPGGRDNIASDAYSFAAGRRARAVAPGCFVWGDSTDAYVTCSISNAFIVRASGGITMYTDSGLSSGVYVPAGGNAWSSVSDRNLKENLALVDGQEVLTLLAEIPVTTWNYKSQDASIRHMGPMAQDFYAAFGLGEDERHISTVDADGVSLAAIQELYQVVQEQETEIAALQQQNADLEAGLAALEQAVGASSSRQPNLPDGWLLLGGLAMVAGLAVQRRRRGGGP